MEDYEKDEEFKRWLLLNGFANLDLKKGHIRNDTRIHDYDLPKTYKMFKAGTPKLMYKKKRIENGI